MKTPKPRRKTAGARHAVITALWVLLSFSLVIGADDAGNYPGKLGIAKARNLTAEQRAVEARFAAYLEANTDAAIARYIKLFGNEIDTDNARELSSDYAPGGMGAEDPASIAARTRWGEAVHEPASALVKAIYRRALAKDTPADRRKQVVFTAGGAGAGKSTSIRKLAELSRAVQAAEIVYDTTLATFASAVERINQALVAGRMVSIVFVYRDPIDSLVDGVLPRAQMMGRIVTLEGLRDTHLGCVNTMLKLASAYKDDPRVAIAVIDNRHGMGNAKPADLAFVQSMARRYTREDLKAKLARALEDAYEKTKSGGKNGIGETIYRAVKGHVQ
jgi:hypothetical protein